MSGARPDRDVVSIGRDVRTHGAGPLNPSGGLLAAALTTATLRAAPWGRTTRGSGIAAASTTAAAAASTRMIRGYYMKG